MINHVNSSRDKKGIKLESSCMSQHVRHVRIQKDLSEGSKFDNGLLIDEGIEDPNVTINGPSSAH